MLSKLCLYLLGVCVCFQSDGNVVASFDRRGQFIISGNSRGKVSKQLYYCTYMYSMYVCIMYICMCVCMCVCACVCVCVCVHNYIRNMHTCA